MTKGEFLAELRGRLSGLSEKDVEESLQYYSEIIDDRVEDGMSEEESVISMGTPREVASHIMAEMSLPKLIKARIKPRRRMNALEIVLLVLGSPIWLSLAAAVLSVVLAVYVVIWSAIVVLWSVDVAFFASSVYGAVSLVAFIISGKVGAGFAIFGMGIFLLGVGIFAVFGCLAATKGMCVLSKKILLGIKSCFIRKECENEKQ